MGLKMKRLSLILIAAAALSLAVAQQKKGSQPPKFGNPFEGAWDLNMTTPSETYPDWIMFSFTDCCMQAKLQPRSGGAVWVNNLQNKGTHLTFPVGDATWNLDLSGDKLTGSIKQGDTVQAQVAGVRAPKLGRPEPSAWTNPEPLFNGKDLTGWEPMNPANNHWVVKDGELVNEEKGSNLKTTRKFDDFKLHIEYNCPDNGNSGIYLRGRYEVQVEYEKPGTEDKYHGMGAIYSFVPPSAELPRKPGEWESFDITLVGRWVTVVRNGVKIINQQQILGITGGALDSN
jgi:hypothetical protein